MLAQMLNTWSQLPELPSRSTSSRAGRAHSCSGPSSSLQHLHELYRATARLARGRGTEALRRLLYLSVWTMRLAAKDLGGTLSSRQLCRHQAEISSISQGCKTRGIGPFRPPVASTRQTRESM